MIEGIKQEIGLTEWTRLLRGQAGGLIEFLLGLNRVREGTRGTIERVKGFLEKVWAKRNA